MRTLNRCNRFILLLATLLVSAGGAADVIKKKQVLDVGFQRETQPFSYVEDGQPRGIEVEIISEAIRRAGYTPRVHIVTLQRLLHRLQAGSLDISSIFLLPSSPFGKNAKNTMVYDQPHSKIKVNIYARKDSDIQLENLVEMLDYRLGQHESAIFYRHPDFPNTRPVSFFRNYQLLFAALLHDRIDLAVSDDLSLAYVSNVNPDMLHGDIQSIFNIDTGRGHLVASRISLGEQGETVLRRVHRELMNIRTDGTIDRVLKDYGLDGVEWDDGLGDAEPK